MDEPKIRCSKVELIDWPSETAVEVVVEVDVPAVVPGPNGLEKTTIRKAVWLQFPIEAMWMLADKAQIPLRNLTQWDIQRKSYSMGATVAEQTCYFCGKSQEVSPDGPLKVGDKVKVICNLPNIKVDYIGREGVIERVGNHGPECGHVMMYNLQYWIPADHVERIP